MQKTSIPQKVYPPPEEPPASPQKVPPPPPPAPRTVPLKQSILKNLTPPPSDPPPPPKQRLENACLDKGVKIKEVRVILRKIPSFQPNENKVADPEQKEGLRIPTPERKIDLPIHEEPKNLKEDNENQIKMVKLKPPTDQENPKMKQKKGKETTKRPRKSENEAKKSNEVIKTS